MTIGAYGLVEVQGASNAVIVVDKMLKIAEVHYITEDTKCGGHVLVFFWQFVGFSFSIFFIEYLLMNPALDTSCSKICQKGSSYETIPHKL